MLDIVIVLIALVLIVELFRQIKYLRQKVYEISSHKEELTKNLIKELRSELCIISTISSGIEVNIEDEKINKDSLMNSLNDMSTSIKNFEDKVKWFERKLLS